MSKHIGTAALRGCLALLSCPSNRLWVCAVGSCSTSYRNPMCGLQGLYTPRANCIVPPTRVCSRILVARTVRCNASDFCLLPFCWSSTAATAYLHIRSFAATFCPSSTAFADACADFGNIDCYHRCTPSNVVWQACLVTSPSLSLLRSPRLALLFDNARGLRAGLFLPEEWVSGFHSCSMYSEIGKHAYLFWVSTMQVRLLSFAYNLPLYSRATAPSKHL
jgi:hypothetical protein